MFFKLTAIKVYSLIRDGSLTTYGDIYAQVEFNPVLTIPFVAFKLKSGE